MKLSRQEADDLIVKVIHERTAHPYIRLGQSLFNHLPRDTANLIHATDNDFFYWTDEIAVLDTFFEHCVQDGK